MKAKSFFEIVKLNKSDNRYRLYIGLNLNGSDVSDLAIPGGENPDDYHVTLLYGYFEPKGDEDDTAVRIQTALEEIKDDIPDRVAFLHEQRFEASESSDKKDVIVARAEGGYLEKVHSELLKELKNNGINVETTFPEYIPHMTLAYIEPGAEYKLRELDHSAAVKDISIDVERKDSKTHENEFKMNKSDSDIDKFNPYHDSLGRFTTSGGGASFSGTLLHGSPNKGIKEFDINRAGSNTGSGEKLLFFTNDKQMADDFSYERLPGSTKFMNVRGKKGEVYRTKVKMKKPLDFRNLSDDDIKAIKELDADGILTDKDIKMMAGMKNHGSLKAGLDLRPETLSRLGYDGIIANAGNGRTEFAVIDSKQTKIIHKSFSEILKFNNNHDHLGRFSSGSSAGAAVASEASSGSYGNVDEFQKDKKETWSATSEFSENKKGAEQHFQAYKDFYSKYQKGTASKDNYYFDTMAEFDPMKSRPRRQPDYVSRDRNGKVSSEYWYTEDGVIRGSDHWGEGVASCDWSLKGVTSGSRPLEIEHTGKKYGKAKWEDFVHKPTVAEINGEKVMSGFHNMSEKGIITHKGTDYEYNRWESKWEPTTSSTAKSFSDVLKFNPYHDRLGRFASGNGGSATFMTIRTRDPKKQHMADKAIARAKEKATAGGAGGSPKSNEQPKKKRTLSDYYKERKQKDMDFFYGKGNTKQRSNKYFEFKRVLDDDNCIVVTNNIKKIKGNPVMITGNNQAVYLKDWQYRPVHNYYEGIDAYAVKLNRKYYKPYTFRFNFDEYDFDKNNTFDDMMDTAKQQEKVNMKFAEGHMG